MHTFYKKIFTVFIMLSYSIESVKITLTYGAKLPQNLNKIPYIIPTSTSVNIKRSFNKEGIF